MAEIFLAVPHGSAAEFRRLVALKRILPHVAEDAAVRTMFLQEARLCLNLSHPAVCAVHELGDDGGALYLVMEWVHGVTLRQLLGRAITDGGLPVGMAVRIASHVAAALHHVHTATDADGRPLGIIHRDVTPENVMVTFDGHVKLIDFGVAKAASLRMLETQKGVLKGKFAYMSPEQYAGSDLDGRADVFSLGACLYELLCGVSPFARGSEYETVVAIVAAEDQTPVTQLRPQVPAALAAVIDRALARDREARFPTAEAMRLALEDYLRTSAAPVLDTTVAEFVGELFRAEIAAGVQVDVRPLAAEERPLSAVDQQWLAAELEDDEARMTKSAARRRRAMWTLIAVVVTVVFVAYAYVIGTSAP
jgi:serine/threonine-protein kinase